MPKKPEGGTFGIFQHRFCRKTSKKLEGDPLEKKLSKTKSHNAKKVKGGLFSLVRFDTLRSKSKKNERGTLSTKFPLA